LTDEGFVPIEPEIASQFDLVPIPAPGLRTCMGNCKCSLEYILVPDGTTPDDLADAMESD
jgi:hypothetical protein